jgi:hypothetical protein
VDVVGEKHRNHLSSQEEKLEVVSKVMHNAEARRTLLIETHFGVFRDKLQGLVGNADAQRRRIVEQKMFALNKLDPSTPFVSELRSLWQVHHVLEEKSENGIATTREFFWVLYRKCEEGAFSKLEREMDPASLALPMLQLLDYLTWVESFDDWDEDEGTTVILAMRRLVQQQLHFILHKNSLWSFDAWYSYMNRNNWCRKKLPSQDWSQISPSDWSTIIGSVLLASSDHYFYEVFGQEKMALERAKFLSNDGHLNASRQQYPTTRGFSAADGCPSLEHALDGSYEKGLFRPKYRHTFECVVRFDTPDKLTNASHWGYLGWSYCNIIRSLNDHKPM